jgi:hypothetical protein
MCRSTEATDAEREFAAAVLRNLLRHIDDQNGKARDQFLVSHARTDGPMMYLVYTAPQPTTRWGSCATPESQTSAQVRGCLWTRRLCTTTSPIWRRAGRHLATHQKLLPGTANDRPVFQSARQISPRRIGIRHLRKRPRQSAAENKIRPSSTSRADMQIRNEKSAQLGGGSKYVQRYSKPVRPGVQKGLVRIWRRSQPRSVISIFRRVWMVRASPAR